MDSQWIEPRSWRPQTVLRVVQVVREFSGAGGVEAVAFELQRAWLDANVDITAVSCIVSKDEPMKTRQTCAVLRHLPTRGRWRYLGRLAAVPTFSLLTIPLLRRLQRETVVVSHGDALVGDVLIVHAVNRESLAQKHAAGQYRWLLNPMHAWVAIRDRWMLGGQRFRRYVAVSQRISEELKKHYRIPSEKIAVIPNGINLSRFSPFSREANTIRQDHGIPPDAKLLLFVGHEFERKGLAFAIDALALMGSNTYLLVVGSDDKRRPAALAASRGVGQRVVFTGARDNLADFYRAADAFVFPTAYESFSLVCMEALACGTPVFAPRVGGIEDYLKDGLNGFTITRNAEDIADKLRYALERPDLMAVLRSGARATAEGYSWPSVANRYRELLETVRLERQSA